MKILYAALLPCVLLTACESDPGALSSTPEMPADDLQRLLQQPLTLRFSVRDESGAALAGVQVVYDGQTHDCSDAGSCELALDTHRNRYLQLRKTGYRDEFLVASAAAQPGDSADLPDVYLHADDGAEMRLLFAGDVAFGRRYFDPLAENRVTALPAVATGLIHPATAESDTKSVLRLFRPLFQSADFASVNLETVVTDNPATPHPYKPFVFFTLPASLPALQWLGVDYVGTGNNHVYDFLQPGIIDTLQSVAAAGFPHSGAGLNEEEAFAAYETTIRGTTTHWLAATSIDGSEYPITYVAEGANKGGAANANNEARLRNALDAANPAHTIIAQVHGGTEYTFEPTAYIRGRMDLIAQNGADLVVSHHPHVAQGVGRTNNTWLLHSLGNFAFDQNRVETMLGIAARVDLLGKQTRAIRLIPVYLKEFVPTPVGGAIANRLFRRLSEHSDAGVYVVPYWGQGWVSNDLSVWRRDTRTLDMEIDIGDSGVAVADLRRHVHSDEFLSEIAADPALSLQAGHDLFGFGDFEDDDSDALDFDATHWDVTSANATVCARAAYAGRAGLCSAHSAGNRDDTVVALRVRVRVDGDATNTPEKDLTLVAYVRGRNAGPVHIVTRYLASTEVKEFGENTIVNVNGGDYDWKMLDTDIPMPADTRLPGSVPEIDEPRAIRVFLRHSPPRLNGGEAQFDEIAIVSWKDKQSLTTAWANARYNTTDFLKVYGAPGRHTLHLAIQRWVPGP